MSVTIASGLIDVGTTSLYHEVRGSGQAVLFIAGATGDADEWSHLTAALAEDFTVVTYDRRGLSRSPRPDGWTITSMPEQAGDAAGLIRALGLASAVVVGHSGGASIACSLVAHHPEVVRHAVLYEPPLLAVVPDGAQVAAGFRAEAEQALAAGGPRRAMEVFLRGNVGDDVFDKALGDPVQRDRVLANGAVFFEVDLPAFAGFVPDGCAMRSSGVRLTVVTGEQNRENWLGAGAAWLAEGSGADRAELPGGHLGFVSHPAEFIALVRRLAR